MSALKIFVSKRGAKGSLEYGLRGASIEDGGYSVVVGRVGTGRNGYLPVSDLRESAILL